MLSSGYVFLINCRHYSIRYFCFVFIPGFLVRVLEEHCCRLNWESTWVFETILEIGILLPTLHRIYDRLFKAKVTVDWNALRRRGRTEGGGGSGVLQGHVLAYSQAWWQDVNGMFTSCCAAQLLEIFKGHCCHNLKHKQLC